jgi:transposase
MIPIPAGVRVWLATGHTDMRKGFDGLALIVHETLKRDPHCGDLFVFRGRRGDLINACGATARVCACSPNDSNVAGFCGRRRLMDG